MLPNIVKCIHHASTATVKLPLKPPLELLKVHKIHNDIMRKRDKEREREREIERERERE